MGNTADTDLYRQAVSFQTSIQGKMSYNPIKDNLEEVTSYAICRETGLLYVTLQYNEGPTSLVSHGISLLDKAALIMIGERTRSNVYECGKYIWEVIDIAEKVDCAQLKNDAVNLGFLGFFLNYWG